MALEIEKKYRLTDKQYAYLLNELADVEASFVGEDFEENTIYGGGILDEKEAVLRIRKTQDKAVLAYKRRIEHELPVKKQIEHETEFKDAESLTEIVANLGFKRRLVYEKKRKTWKFRSVEIVLDELPFGLFAEIEGSFTDIKEAEMILGLEEFETEHETYSRLTSRLGTQNGEVVEARFDLRKSG